jgi:hypothetical protein
MDQGNSKQNPPPGEDPESLALERRWYEGRLLLHVDRLMAFVDKNQAEILQLAGANRDVGSLVRATQSLIEQKGSVHLPSELRDQIEEMNAELWYHGEKGDRDSARIKQEWTTLHAANWRRWRIKEYLFIAERCAGEIEARFNRTF